MSLTPERTPVIIGIGEILDRPEDPANGLEPLALMEQALRRAESDAGANLLFTYSYTTTSGNTLSLNNLLMGSQPTFKLVLSEQYQGKTLTLSLNAVVSPKLSLAFKNEDFMIPEFDFQAAADAAGNIGNIWLSE